MHIDVKKLYAEALANLNEREPENLKGVIGLTSRDKTPEPLEKGILRAKHGINIFKDGTVRYDLTDLPLTHFRPSEIGTGLEKLKELGYTENFKGEPLTSVDHTCELKVQDIILSKDAGGYLLKVAQFVDDLLVKFYNLAPYYKAKSSEDLLGALFVGSTQPSAGIVTAMKTASCCSWTPSSTSQCRTCRSGGEAEWTHH
jgi:DNA polymerase II large subunit